MNKIVFLALIALAGSLITGCVEPRASSNPVPQGSPQSVGDCSCSSLITCSCGSTAKP